MLPQVEKLYLEEEKNWFLLRNGLIFRSPVVPSEKLRSKGLYPLIPDSTQYIGVSQ